MGSRTHFEKEAFPATPADPLGGRQDTLLVASTAIQGLLQQIEGLTQQLGIALGRIPTMTGNTKTDALTLDLILRGPELLPPYELQLIKEAEEHGKTLNIEEYYELVANQFYQRITEG